MATTKSPMKSLTFRGILVSVAGILTLVGSALIPAIDGLEAANAAPADAAVIVQATLDSLNGLVVALGTAATAIGNVMALVGRWRASSPLQFGAK